jgi:hypothetical protein
MTMPALVEVFGQFMFSRDLFFWELPFCRRFVVSGDNHLKLVRLRISLGLVISCNRKSVLNECVNLLYWFGILPLIYPFQSERT